MNVEHYSHVMHISSTVNGELQDHLTSWDALRAALPVGTVSGAPKVKAMELIDKLEVTRLELHREYHHRDLGTGCIIPVKPQFEGAEVGFSAENGVCKCGSYGHDFSFKLVTGMRSRLTLR